MDFPVWQILIKNIANATFVQICSYLLRSKDYICLTFVYMAMLVNATFSSHLLSCVNLSRVSYFVGICSYSKYDCKFKICVEFATLSKFVSKVKFAQSRKFDQSFIFIIFASYLHASTARTNSFVYIQCAASANLVQI